MDRKHYRAKASDVSFGENVIVHSDPEVCILHSSGSVRMSTLLNKGENLETTHPFTPLPTAVTTPAPDIAVPPGEKDRCLDVNDDGTWPHQS